MSAEGALEQALPGLDPAAVRAAADAHVLHSAERARGGRRMVVERASGSRVWDIDGKEYLDAVSGTNGTALVGYGHPAVNAAIERQLETLSQTCFVYDSPALVALANKLAEITPAGLGKTYVCVGGGEAIEAAVKLAMRVTGRAEVVSLYGAYHGLTLGTSGLVGMPSYRSWMPGSGRWPNFRQAPAATCYRCPLGLTYPSCEVACAKALEAVITQAGSGNVAALVLEAVQGPGGHVPYPEEWYGMVADICRRNDVLLIVDEVQTALGRCGELFASDLYGLEPDMMVVGKAFGGGVPFGAVIVREDLVPAEVESEPWIVYTFQNQPLPAAAASAVIDVVLDEGLTERARVLGDRARARLEPLRERYQCIGDIRGPGLFIGMDLVKDRETREPATEACARGFDHALDIGLLTWFGGAGNVLKLKPPLTTSDEDFEAMLDRIEDVIAYVDREV